MDLDSNGAQRPFGYVLDGSYKGVSIPRAILGMGESRFLLGIRFTEP
jgi:hypothetical protein